MSNAATQNLPNFNACEKSLITYRIRWLAITVYGGKSTVD